MTEEIKINTELIQINPQVSSALRSVGEVLANIENSHFAEKMRSVNNITETAATYFASIMEELRPITIAVAKSVQTLIQSESYKNMISIIEQLQKIAEQTDSMSKSVGNFEINEELAEKYSDRIVQENLYDTTLEGTKKSVEETGQPIPYKVFSNKFIYNVYIPTMSAFNTLSNGEEFSQEFITKFIIFTLLPIIYFLSTMKEEKKGDIELPLFS